MKCLFKTPAHLVGVLAATAAVGLVIPATSSAALLATGACDNASLSQPFAQFGDSAQYKLVPGGLFEDGASGWKLGPGAAVVSGGPTGQSGSHSLHLPAGASAESPPTCVNASYPTFRMFAKNANLLSTVAVQVVYEDPVLGRVSLPVGAIALSTSWKPTLTMLTASAVQGVLKNGVAQVSLRLTALTGATNVAGVYVDPRYGH